MAVAITHREGGQNNEKSDDMAARIKVKAMAFWLIRQLGCHERKEVI
jgi:hypothetical protein